MLIREIQAKEKEVFNKMVNSVTQSWEWGEFREKTGKKVVRLGEFEGENLKKGVSIFFHPLPYFNFSIGYIPRCLGLNKSLMEAVLEIARKERAVFVKIEREEEFDFDKGKFNLVKGKSVLPKYTLMVDLEKEEKEILGSMAEKTRYNIRLGLRHKVEIKEGKEEKDLEVFIKLLRETEERQGFYSHYPDYYRMLWEVMGDKMRKLLIGYYNKKAVSAIMLFKFKDRLYYPYGGSSLEYREKMANYVIHWEAIKLGKKLGCRVYDMWGAFKESRKETDPWFGIYRFKKGFGGKLVEYPDSLDLVIDERLYKGYLFADKIRWGLLNLKRKVSELVS